MKNTLLFTAFLCFVSNAAMAWDGYDYGNGSFVEIERNNLVREGNDIEIYDYGAAQYKEVEVQDVIRHGNSIEVEVYDRDTGEYRTLDMEDY